MSDPFEFFEVAGQLAAFRAKYGPIKRQALRDGDICLATLRDKHIDGILEVAAAHPEFVDTMVFPNEGQKLGRLDIRGLCRFWELGNGMVWVVQYPDPAGLVWAVRTQDPSRWALGGARYPHIEHPPGYGARTMRLVAGWVRQTCDATAYVAIPCDEPRYIEWAEESGLEWDTKLPQLLI